MKRTIITALLGAFIMTSCTQKLENGISIHLQKRAGECKGYGLMGSFNQKEEQGFGSLYPDIKVAPKGWTDVTYYYNMENAPQALFQSYKQGLIDKEFCMNMFEAWGMDTLDYSAQPLKLFITAAIGVNEQKDTCIVFDSNANLDLSDDRPMLLNNQHPMPVYIERWMNGKIVPDSAYVYSQNNRGNLYLRQSEIVEQNVILKNKEYLCRIEHTSGNYEYHSIINVQFITSDTTYKYHPKQYAILDGSYYLIDSLSVDGRYLHLTEEPDAEHKEVMQEGFRPYSFTATTLQGDTVCFPDDFKGKYVLLDFWATSCGPCVQEIEQTYPVIYEKYKDKGFEILAIANNTSDEINRFMEKYPMSWMLVADRDQNNKLMNQFHIVAYPTLYLINPEGKICASDYSLRPPMLEQTLEKLIRY